MKPISRSRVSENLYRTVAEYGDTVDFLLTEQRDKRGLKSNGTKTYAKGKRAETYGFILS